MNYYLLLAYLIGAIPTSVWIGKHFYKLDVREHGSGNAGATNTFRVIGKKAGIIVLTFDILKAWVATVVLSQLAGTTSIDYKLAFGLMAVFGHIFPVYIGFRGGKGIASLLGVIIGVHPLASLLCIIVFVLTLLISRYVSLSSIIAALCFPLLLVFHFKTDESALIVFSVMVSVLVVFTHKKNIERLFNKEESKVKITRKIFKRKSKA